MLKMNEIVDKNLEKNIEKFPVIHELVQERQFPHFFWSQYPGKYLFAWLLASKKVREIAILGLKYVSPAGNPLPDAG